MNGIILLNDTFGCFFIVSFMKSGGSKKLVIGRLQVNEYTL